MIHYQDESENWQLPKWMFLFVDILKGHPDEICMLIVKTVQWIDTIVQLIICIRLIMKTSAAPQVEDSILWINDLISSFSGTWLQS